MNRRRNTHRNQTYTHSNIFEVLLNQPEIRLYKPFSDRFGSKRTSVWIQINRKKVNTIWFRFDLTRLRKNFSVCKYTNKQLFASPISTDGSLRIMRCWQTNFCYGAKAANLNIGYILYRLLHTHKFLLNRVEINQNPIAFPIVRLI